MFYKSAYNSNKIVRLALPVTQQPTEVYNSNPNTPVFNTSFKHPPHIMGAVQSAFKALPRPFQEHFMNSKIPMSHPSFSKGIDYNPNASKQEQFHDVFGKTAHALSNHINNAFFRKNVSGTNPNLVNYSNHQYRFNMAAMNEGSPFNGGKPFGIGDNTDFRKYVGDLTHTFLRHIHTNGLHNKPFKEQLDNFHNKLYSKFPITANAFHDYMSDAAKHLQT